MRYVKLAEHCWLRGWRDQKYAIYNSQADGWDSNRVIPLTEMQFEAVKIAAAAGVDIDSPFLLPAMRRSAERLLELKIFESCNETEGLTDKQQYRYADTRRIDVLHWEITGRCNLRCKHCYYAAGETPGVEPSLAQCREIIRQLLEANAYAVDLTGGEPFCRPDFWQLMELLKENDIRVDQIFTNGTLVTEDTFRRLEDLQIRPDCFLVSFDGLGWHDWMRGLNGTEEKTLRAIRLMREHGFPVVVTSVVHNESIESILPTYELMKELGVGLWRVAPVINTGSWKMHDREETELGQLFEKYLQLLQLWQTEGRPLILRLSSFFEGILPDGSWNIPALSGCGTAEQETIKLCEFSHSNPHLLSDGRLLPCLVMNDTKLAELVPNIFSPGSNFSQALLDTKIEGYNVSTYSDLFQHNEKCRDCDYRFRCTHCPAEALIESGDYYGNISAKCFLAKGGYEDRISAILNS